MATTTFGETLKREREKRKISLREVSEATKIGVRHLEAMESNHLERLPGGLFNKGFIRAYAKFLELDPEALVSSYLYDVAHLPGASEARRRVEAAMAEDAIPIAWQELAKSRSRRLPSGGVLAALGAAVVVIAAGAWLLSARAPAMEREEPAEPEPAQKAGLLRPRDAGAKPPELPAGPDLGAGETAVDPGTMSRPEDTPPAPDAAPSKPARPERAPWRLALFLSTTETTDVSLYCGGVETLSRELMPGETVSISCASEAFLSASNAGALLVKVNGKDCMPLGERGDELVNFPLNRERTRDICSDDREHS
jgi:cytoskeletal protein RodZ